MGSRVSRNTPVDNASTFPPPSEVAPVDVNRLETDLLPQIDPVNTDASQLQTASPSVFPQIDPASTLVGSPSGSLLPQIGNVETFPQIGNVETFPQIGPASAVPQIGPASAVPHPPQIYPYNTLPHQLTIEELDIKPTPEGKSLEPDLFLKKYVGNLDELVPPGRGWSMFVRLDRYEEAEKLFSCLRSDLITIQKAYTYDPIVCYFVIADTDTLKQLATKDYVRRLVRKAVFTIC